VTDFEAAAITSPDFVDRVGRTFNQATPYMRFLCDAVGVPF